MASENKIIQELIDTIEEKQNSFMGKLPNIQKKILDEIIVISKEFYVPAKTIKQQAYNLKLIAKIKQKIDGVLLTDEYNKAVKDFVKGFDKIENIQYRYFATIATTGKSIEPLLKEIKKSTISITVDKLSIDGIGGVISGKVRDILLQNITKGGSYSSMVNELKDFILDSKDADGSFTRYAKQIVTDSLNQYSANYTKAVTDDLGLEWYAYVGSLREKSRPFCKALIKAKKSCMPYIHKSQLKNIASGLICGSEVSTAGMIEGTNGENFQILRGGYNCNHQLIPVSEALVPKELRDLFS